MDNKKPMTQEELEQYNKLTPEEIAVYEKTIQQIMKDTGCTRERMIEEAEAFNIW